MNPEVTRLIYLFKSPFTFTNLLNFIKPIMHSLKLYIFLLDLTICIIFCSVVNVFLFGCSMIAFAGMHPKCTYTY